MDTLRFVAAFFVVMAHVLSEPPIFEWLGLDATTGVLKIIQGIYWKFFFTGISGVVVFFIISGLCIHLPNARGLQIRCLKSYFTRRLLRILPPVVPIVMLYHYADGLTIGQCFSKTILWSVVCEVIYYLIYPLLLAIRRNHYHGLTRRGIGEQGRNMGIGYEAVLPINPSRAFCLWRGAIIVQEGHLINRASDFIIDI